MSIEEVVTYKTVLNTRMKVISFKVIFQILLIFPIFSSLISVTSFDSIRKKYFLKFSELLLHLSPHRGLFYFRIPLTSYCQFLCFVDFSVLEKQHYLNIFWKQNIPRMASNVQLSSMIWPP